MYSSNPRELSSGKKSLTPKSNSNIKFATALNGSSIDRIKSSISFTRTDSRSKVMNSRPVSTKSQHGENKFFSSKPVETRKKSLNSMSPAPLRDSRKSSGFVNQTPTNQRSQNKINKRPSRDKSHSPVRVPEQYTRTQIFISPKHFNIKPRQIRHSINSHPFIHSKYDIQFVKQESARYSDKTHGTVKCYSACTNQGNVRDYNQDRVAIVLKKVAYFGVFDGHGGDGCSNYLRDKLISYVTQDKNFLTNIAQAINQGFHRCEQAFTQFSKSSPYLDRSGSCAIAVFIHEDMCYVSNVGDSRAIMSSCRGDRVSELSLDHKPTDQYQQKRIIQNGGKIYQVKLVNVIPGATLHYEGQEVPFVMGPHRVFPGRLSITRTFGDIQAKLPQFGGNPKAVISTPQIRSFRLTKDNDFIIIASDGIFDRLSNDQVIQIVWETAKDRSKYKNIHQLCGLAVQNIIKYSLFKRTQDNVTVVMIGFENLQRTLFPENYPKSETKQPKKHITIVQNRSTSKSRLFDSRQKDKPSTKSSRSNLLEQKKPTLRKPTTPKGRLFNGINSGMFSSTK